MSIDIRRAVRSHRGLVRRQNEDRWFADLDQKLFVVSDGMGGQGAGGVASQIAVELLPKRIARACPANHDIRDPVVQAAVADAIRRLSKEIHEESQGQPSVAGLGATVVMALIRERTALIANLGDSRCYHLHDRRLARVSMDHTVAQHLVNAGEISSVDRDGHPMSGRLTQYVGMAPPLHPHMATVELAPDDRLLLCTDGLTHAVSDEQISGILQDTTDLDAACEQFVDASHAAGGEDNVTVLVIESNCDVDQPTSSVVSSDRRE